MTSAGRDGPVVVEPGRRSWVGGADGSGRPLQHLPYGVVSPPGGRPRVAVAIGPLVLDLAAVAGAGLLDGVADQPGRLFDGPSLEPLLSAGRPVWSRLRHRLVDLLAEDGPDRPPDRALSPRDGLALHPPVAVADLVDFYASRHHAARVGGLLRPEQPLADNWHHLPAAYHGRAGTVVVSGTPVERPVGQSAPPRPGAVPRFGPTRQLDFELELGFLTGLPEPRSRLRTDEATEVVFGVVLVDDWSARDLQAWEQQPLGPFLGKSFATSIGGWVTPLDALLPFRVPAPVHDPPPLPYLRTEADWGLDLALEARLTPSGGRPTTVTRTNARHLHWTIPQMLAHATVNGATARSGDLYASGTVSGPGPEARACLLELTAGGEEPLALADGGGRTFLEDGDTVTLVGGAGGGARPRITLAPVVGTVRPAPRPGP